MRFFWNILIWTAIFSVTVEQFSVSWQKQYHAKEKPIRPRGPVVDDVLEAASGLIEHLNDISRSIDRGESLTGKS